MLLAAILHGKENKDHALSLQAVLSAEDYRASVADAARQEELGQHGTTTPQQGSENPLAIVPLHEGDEELDGPAAPAGQQQELDSHHPVCNVCPVVMRQRQLQTTAVSCQCSQLCCMLTAHCCKTLCAPCWLLYCF